MRANGLVGFLVSTGFHGAILGGLWLLVVHSNGVNGFNAPNVDKHISMEMIKGMTTEVPQPVTQPTPPALTEKPKEEVADPTVKPEPKIEPKKIKKEPPKPEKPKIVEEKSKKQKVRHKKKTENLEKGKKIIRSKANINSKATSNGRATGDNPNLVGSGVQTDEISAYLSALRREIERQKRYPKRAKMMRKQGTVMVMFTLSVAGEISNVQVAKSSGVKDLDDEAVRAVKKAYPIGVRPQGIGSQITQPIAFRFR